MDHTLFHSILMKKLVMKQFPTDSIKEQYYIKWLLIDYLCLCELGSKIKAGSK